MLVWEEIHGFQTLGEYERFVRYLEDQVRAGYAEELPADPSYGKGLLYGGRWFRDGESAQVWRLVGPDPPFRGLWEPVKQQHGRPSGALSQSATSHSGNGEPRS
jgi:hypothetical protein